MKRRKNEEGKLKGELHFSLTTDKFPNPNLFLSHLSPHLFKRRRRISHRISRRRFSHRRLSSPLLSLTPLVVATLFIFTPIDSVAVVAFLNFSRVLSPLQITLMAPLKTKKLSMLEEPAVNKSSIQMKVLSAAIAHRRSSRMAVRFAHARNKNNPPTSLSNPVVVESDNSDQSPRRQNPPEPPQNNSPPSVDSHVQSFGDDEPLCNMKTLRPKATSKHKTLPSQANAHVPSKKTVPPKSHPTPPHNLAPLQQSTSHLPVPLPSRSNVPPPQRSGSHPQRSSQQPRVPPPPSLEEFSNHLLREVQQASADQPPVREVRQPSADQHPSASQPNVQLPEKPKSIRVKFGEDIEVHNGKHRGVVNGLRLEIHCHTIGCKIKVEKDIDGKTPANEMVISLLTHDIGAYIKDRMPMVAATYAELPKQYRDDLIDHLSLHFELPKEDTWLWEFIWKCAARRYSNWKCHCHNFYREENGEVPAEFIWRTDQWAWLCNHFSDPKFKSKSIHCGNIRKNSKSLNHHLGKTTLKARAKKFARENHSTPYIAAFEEAYAADPNGSMLVV